MIIQNYFLSEGERIKNYLLTIGCYVDFSIPQGCYVDFSIPQSFQNSIYINNNGEIISGDLQTLEYIFGENSVITSTDFIDTIDFGKIEQPLPFILSSCNHDKIRQVIKNDELVICTKCNYRYVRPLK